MSTFICTKCGCIDNTSMNNNYWTRNLEIFSGEADKVPLCQECTPSVYKDGSSEDKEVFGSHPGEWHNVFEKRHWTNCGTKEEIVAEFRKGEGCYINALEYFKIKE